MDVIIKLPEDIQRYIYEFDPTYKIKYSYCMVSISMMSNELLRKNKIYSVIQPTKNTFYFYIYMDERGQKNCFETRRNNVYFIKELNHFKTDNPQLWGDTTQHNKNITIRRNYRFDLDRFDLL
tara:strand:- start:207 stop:575 length:369 start_codon:yes stop_codon:yes gene_type:complete